MSARAPLIGVYGLGRFGRFWADLLSRRMRVIGASRSRKDNLPEGVTQCAPEELVEAEAVFLCVAISAMEESSATLSGLLRPEQLVLDTCSVKVYPSRVMEERFAPEQPLIATHPMFGPDSARNGVRGLPIIVHPLRNAREESETWRNRFEEMGLKIVEMTPEEHDREAAYTQGITHFIGRVLSRLELPDSAIATLGYRKIQEVIEQTCNDPYQLFRDLQHYNPYTSAMREELSWALEATLRDLQ
ncbi:MAG: prephenate dehydrogenase/arogenate dehydrogenase family protein [Spirochaetaceae bacterium]